MMNFSRSGDHTHNLEMGVAHRVQRLGDLRHQYIWDAGSSRSALMHECTLMSWIHRPICCSTQAGKKR